MKSFLTVILFILTATCFSQKVLIPYRSGKQFGLCDANGKLLVPAQYDMVHWMQDGWFETGKKIELKDTLETSPGKFFIRNSTAKLTGLIYNGTVILKDEPFDDYEIIANKCIVAEYQRRPEELTKEQFKKYGPQRKGISLFNLKGKNLYPENFKRIQKVDTTGTSSRDKNSGRYILFISISLKDRYSMFVFDADEQKISEWLVKDAIKIEGNRKMIADKQIGFTITDSTYNSTVKILDYTGGKFILAANPSKPAVKQPAGGSEKVAITEVTSDPGGYDVAVPPAMEGDPEQRRKPVFNPYHIIIKDTLFYLRTSYQDKNPVNLGPGGKVITLQQRAITQYQPVIVKSGNHFYIVKEDKLGTVAYDSLIYFGKYFIAWQKINGQTKAGVIDADGIPAISMEYDSIYADIKYLELKDLNPAGKSNYSIHLREADSKYDNNIYPYKRSFSSFITVFKNGHCGIMNMKGETVVPLQYELIARNNLQHSRPREDEFIIVKQNNQYGIANFKYNKEKKMQELIPATLPAFDYIPGFYYPDYYGIKDFKLVGLYDEHFEFKGFANGNGKKYYKE